MANARFTRLALLRWSLFIGPLRRAAGLDDQCKDPLFETHWFGKSDIHTLSSIPTVKTDLRLCPQYNSLASCCSEEFELEQMRYFEDYRSIIFAAAISRVGKHRQSVLDVQRTPTYTTAGHVEREQYNHAIEAYNPVLTPAVHGDCLSAILTYVAGMNCFSCRSDWFRFVTIENGLVVRVHVNPSVCMEIWSRCEVFGEAAKNLKQSLLDSVLAKQANQQVENLDMFFDQQALCSFLHNEVALHPFQRPSMTEREAAPGVHKEPVDPHAAAAAAPGGPAAPMSPAGKAVPPGNAAFPTAMPYATATSAAPPTARRLVESPKHELDVMQQGKLSTFDIVWPGASGVGLTAPCLWLLMLALLMMPTAISNEQR